MSKQSKKQPKKTGNLWLILAVLLVVVAVVYKLADRPAPVEPAAFVPTHRAEIVMEGYGTIKLELDGNAAPITVANFEKLANSGFYDGLTFHRIIEGFMMQGGDPEGSGFGGSGENIKGEFLNNGVQNTLSHTRGAISMARSKAYDSASSQFFIVHQDSSRSLDGDYACFGYVTEGMDIVDAICAAANPTDNNGKIAVSKRPRMESVRVEPIG